MTRLLTAVFATAVASLLLASCVQTQQHSVTDTIENVSGEAAASVGAAREINHNNPDQNVHTAVVDRELSLAQDRLPKPTAEQALAALERAYAALQADNATLARMYAAEQGKTRMLLRSIQDAKEIAAAEQARQDAMTSMKMKLALMFGSASIAALGGAALAYALFKHKRLALILAVNALILMGASLAIASIPNAHIIAMFWVMGGLLTLSLFAGAGYLFYGYKVGLYQKPQSIIRKGDYSAEFQIA